MDTSFGQRIKNRRTQLGMTQSELAQRVGISQPSLANIERGTTVRTKYLSEFAKALHTSVQWLVTGTGEQDLSPHDSGQPWLTREQAFRLTQKVPVRPSYMLGDNADLMGPKQDAPTEDEFALIPLLDVKAACGNGKFNDHVIVKGGLAFSRADLKNLGVPEHAARSILAEGHSMDPTIKHGRRVLLNVEDKEPQDNKVYAICTPDNGLILKRLVRDYSPAAGAVVWILRSDNPNKTEYPDKILPPDERTIIAGRAVWHDGTL